MPRIAEVLKDFVCLVLVVCVGLLRFGGAVEIRRLSVPRYVQNGTISSLVLDCDYVYSENDLRLVVKWFFEDNLEPVYQWIPALNTKHTSGVLKNRLDLDFSVNTIDAYSRYRALRILNPTTEISGRYTCLVTSLAGQDSKEQLMTVYVPAHEFELSYFETSFNTVNVSCEALGLFPYPTLRLYVRLNSGSAPHPVADVVIRSHLRPPGAYDVFSHRTFAKSELSPKGATVFECMLELPGTNYQQSKRIAYLPGIQSPRLEAPYELSSSTLGLHQIKGKLCNVAYVFSICALLQIFSSVSMLKT